MTSVLGTWAWFANVLDIAMFPKILPSFWLGLGQHLGQYLSQHLGQDLGQDIGQDVGQDIDQDLGLCFGQDLDRDFSCYGLSIPEE